MDFNTLRKKLKWDECVECGACLTRCRYMKFTIEEAQEEIAKVNRGEPSRVLQGCMSCYACNAFCERNTHPYERIHYSWNERYEKEGLPLRASYLMPSRRPNFREAIPFSKHEKALHQSWGIDDPPAKTVLYPGCNILAMPLLLPKTITELLPVWGRWDFCCGEMYFRMGIISAVEKIAANLTAFYSNRKLEEMVFVCPACYNMFTNVLPEQFGAKFSFRTTTFTDWFARKLEDGEITIKKKLKGDVVIQDSCHGRILGNKFMDSERSLLKTLGLNVIETSQNREDGLCCGMAAGCNSYSAIDLLRFGIKNLTALDRTAATSSVQYCTGCYLTSSIMRIFKPVGKKLTHTLEWVGQALGDEIAPGNYRKAFSILRGIGLHALPKYLSKKYFKI